MQYKYKIVIADDHPIVRQGLVNIVEENDSFNIVAQSGDGTETLQLIEEHQPDIVLLDISMPGLDGLEIVKKSGERGISCKFIILTMYDDKEYFDRAMDLGVKGYLLKENAVNDLTDCLNSVTEGKHYICPEISGHLLDRDIQKDTLSFLDTLTKTEQQILELISENKTSKQIADELYISLRTVQNHRNNITHKLDLQGHNKLLQFALENKKYIKK